MDNERHHNNCCRPNGRVVPVFSAGITPSGVATIDLVSDYINLADIHVAYLYSMYDHTICLSSPRLNGTSRGDLS